MPLFFVGIVIALLLAAIPSSTPHRRHNMYDRKKDIDLNSESRKDAEDTNRAVAVVSGIFWIFIIILLISIIFGYMV